jgi:hypothetical protein
VKAILQHTANITGIHFVQTTVSNAADFYFSAFDLPGQHISFRDSGGSTEKIHLNNSDFTNANPGSPGYLSLLKKT